MRSGIHRRQYFVGGTAIRLSYRCEPNEVLVTPVREILQTIVVGLWGATENVTDATRRVRDSGADEVVTTLTDAVLRLTKLAPPLAEQVITVGLHPIAKVQPMA